MGMTASLAHRVETAFTSTIYISNKNPIGISTANVPKMALIRKFRVETVR